MAENNYSSLLQICCLLLDEYDEELSPEYFIEKHCANEVRPSLSYRDHNILNFVRSFEAIRRVREEVHFGDLLRLLRQDEHPERGRGRLLPEGVRHGAQERAQHLQR